MAKKAPSVVRGRISKKRYLTHIGTIYEVTFEDGVAKMCACIHSPLGLTPTNAPFGIDQKQIDTSIGFGLWKEITE